MIEFIKRFGRAQDGAVTVDWVVLTAAVVGLSVAAIVGIHGTSKSVGDGVGTYLTKRSAGE